MDSDFAIQVSNVGKVYRIFDKPQDRLKDTLCWRFGKRYGRDFWALKDIAFEVKKGESIGIIGRNGSGKSTLLQIIAGTLQCTTGIAKVNGRVAALLELGSGFNPDYTGRENVYMNASILGLSEEETDARFDAIASFADIGQFLDQPVKTYSSGMMVRLAFAVQTAVDPTILLVDEALAVGDAKFQRSCYQRLSHLKSCGTTLLFASHDLGAIVDVCDEALLLDGGLLIRRSSPREAVKHYQEILFSAPGTEAVAPRQTKCDSGNRHIPEPTPACPSELREGNGGADIRSFGIHDPEGRETTVLETGARYTIYFWVLIHRHVDSIFLAVIVRTITGSEVFFTNTDTQRINVEHVEPDTALRVSVQVNMELLQGDYFLGFTARDGTTATALDRRMDVHHFRVISPCSRSKGLVELSPTFNVMRQPAP